MRGGPTKMVIFGHRRGGGPTPQKSRNDLFLGKFFKFQGGGGPDPQSPPPSGSAHVTTKVHFMQIKYSHGNKLGNTFSPWGKFLKNPFSFFLAILKFLSHIFHRLLHCACVGFENPITQADSCTPIFTSKHSWM